AGPRESKFSVYEPLKETCAWLSQGRAVRIPKRMIGFFIGVLDSSCREVRRVFGIKLSELQPRQNSPAGTNSTIRPPPPFSSSFWAGGKGAHLGPPRQGGRNAAPRR